jgi:hypothetical protein
VQPFELGPHWLVTLGQAFRFAAHGSLRGFGLVLARYFNRSAAVFTLSLITHRLSVLVVFQQIPATPRRLLGL